MNCFPFIQITNLNHQQQDNVCIWRSGVKCQNRLWLAFQLFNWTYKSPKWKNGLYLRSKCQVTFDAALTDYILRQFKTRKKKMAACFVTLFCLACNTVPENWHICVNKGLTNVLNSTPKKIPVVQYERGYTAHQHELVDNAQCRPDIPGNTGC